MDLKNLITPEYQKMNKDIYNTSKRSAGGAKHAPIVMDLAMHWAAYNILDYGCGQGKLKETIDSANAGYSVTEYDPGIIGKDTLPVPTEFVACTDVLEHIEPELIDNVLDHVFSLMLIGGYFVISLCETKVWLPDGRNAHLLIKPVDWWLEKLLKYKEFEIVHCNVRIKKHELKDLILHIRKKAANAG